MFHKIKTIRPMPEMKLFILFSEGEAKIYDVKPLLNKFKVFKDLENTELFNKVYVDTGGYGAVWNDSLDLSCDELYFNGETIPTPFDNLMAFSDATELWGLNESTLRKAIEYGRLIDGVDVCKFGKQWIISKDAMYREYGEPHP